MTILIISVSCGHLFFFDDKATYLSSSLFITYLDICFCVFPKTRQPGKGFDNYELRSFYSFRMMRQPGMVLDKNCLRSFITTVLYPPRIDYILLLRSWNLICRKGSFGPYLSLRQIRPHKHFCRCP